MFISNAAVDQENGHKRYVEIRKNMIKTTTQAVCQGAHQVSSVVKMAGHTPESWNQQFTVMFSSIGWCVGTFKIFGFLAPYFTVAISATEEIFLMIGHSENIVAHQTQ